MRDLIDSRGLTAYGAAKRAGVDPAVISRFLTGERDIRMGTADKLAAALGLRLVEVGRGAKGRGKTRPSDTPAAVDRVRPPEAPDREFEDFAINLGAGEVYDESDGSQIATNRYNDPPAVAQDDTGKSRPSVGPGGPRSCVI